MYQENKLFGKTVIFNGDSICAGSERRGSWATRIAPRNQLAACKNYAIGGGTIAENTKPHLSGAARHSVSATLDKMYEEFPNADYIVLEGGTNDADLLGRITEGEIAARFGKVDPDDYSGNYDRETFCGALESIFYRATRYWKGKKIAFIVAHKMGLKPPSAKNRRAYFDAAIEICKKWGIPYLDLWNTCYLNPMLPWMYDPSLTPDENMAGDFLYSDGQHLTPRGYDLTADIIDSFLKTL